MSYLNKKFLSLVSRWRKALLCLNESQNSIYQHQEISFFWETKLRSKLTLKSEIFFVVLSKSTDRRKAVESFSGDINKVLSIKAIF